MQNTNSFFNIFILSFLKTTTKTIDIESNVTLSQTIIPIYELYSTAILHQQNRSTSTSLPVIEITNEMTTSEQKLNKISSVTNAIEPITIKTSLIRSSSSTKVPEKPHNTLLYTLFVVLFVILSIAIMSLAICFIHYNRERHQSSDDSSVDMFNPSSSNTHTTMNSDKIQSKSFSNKQQLASPLLPKEYQEINFLNKHVGPTFNDADF